MAASQRPTPKDKRRRRKRRFFSLLVYSIIVFGLAWFFGEQATTTIIFVRHTDTDLPAAPGSDPPLNARGLARAELLADFLEDIDVVAGVDAIYASPLKRTQQTAAPLAKRLSVDVAIADHYDYVGFMGDVLSDHKGQIVLVVTQADAIAPLVEELHGSKNVPEMEADEYDNVYIVSIPWFAKVKTLRLRYGLGWTPPVGQTSSGVGFEDEVGAL